MILLTEEEMRAVCYGDEFKMNVTCEIPRSVEYSAKAQLKKVLEYLDRRSFSMQPDGESAIWMIVCDRKALLKETE